MLNFACTSSGTPENGSGGLVSKPYSVMNSGRFGATLPVAAAIWSSSSPSSEMFAIVSESGWGSRCSGEMFFV